MIIIQSCTTGRVGPRSASRNASHATEDKLYCIYIAPDAEIIREHGRRGNFPVDSIREIKVIIDPTTAEG